MALDSLRGFCALAVVVFHFRTTGNVTNLSFFRHSWMFVDFFFVLSGFVIANAYSTRFEVGSVSVGQFMGLRLGRIYPLHFAVILAMMGMELLLTAFDLTEFSDRQPFEGSHSWSALASNLGLLHAFGFHDRPTWNIPSWSIAAEVWTYLVFAVVWSMFRRIGWLIMAAIGIAALLALAAFSPRHLNTTYELGFVRCLFGFSVGALAHRWSMAEFPIGGTGAELLSLVSCGLFVTLVGSGIVTLAAPLVFVVPVFAFARGEGLITRVLSLRPFVWLGTISYSIYMVHAFVQGRIADLVQVFGKPLGLRIQPKGNSAEFPSETIVGMPLALDVLTLAMVGLVLVTASISYSLIEKTFREGSRKILIKPTVKSQELAAR